MASPSLAEEEPCSGGVGAKHGAGFVILSEPLSPHLAVPRLVLAHGRKRCPNWFCSRLDSPRLVGRHRGFSSPFAVAGAEILVVSGKAAMKRERTPGSIWVPLGESWFVGSCSPRRVPLLPVCCLELPGRREPTKARLALRVVGNHLFSSPFVLVCADKRGCAGQTAASCLACAFCSLCFLWQNAVSCPSPVTCLAASLVVQTCSAKEGEEWVLPMRRMSC